MRSCVYPLVIFLILTVLAVAAIDASSTDFSHPESKYSSSDTDGNLAGKFKRPAVAKIHRPVVADVIAAKNKTSAKNGIRKVGKIRTKAVKTSTDVAANTNKLGFIDLTVKSKTDLESRERRRKKKERMNKAAMALLMAYKLKFAALIPTIIGGTLLLIAATTLAGFFFALFAAVLGLKVH